MQAHDERERVVGQDRGYVSRLEPTDRPLHLNAPHTPLARHGPVRHALDVRSSHRLVGTHRIPSLLHEPSLHEPSLHEPSLHEAVHGTSPGIDGSEATASIARRPLAAFAGRHTLPTSKFSEQTPFDWLARPPCG